MHLFLASILVSISIANGKEIVRNEMVEPNTLPDDRREMFSNKLFSCVKPDGTKAVGPDKAVNCTFDAVLALKSTNNWNVKGIAVIAVDECNNFQSIMHGASDRMTKSENNDCYYIGYQVPGFLSSTDDNSPQTNGDDVTEFNENWCSSALFKDKLCNCSSGSHVNKVGPSLGAQTQQIINNNPNVNEAIDKIVKWLKKKTAQDWLVLALEKKQSDKDFVKAWRFATPDWMVWSVSATTDQAFVAWIPS